MDLNNQITKFKAIYFNFKADGSLQLDKRHITAQLYVDFEKICKYIVDEDLIRKVEANKETIDVYTVKINESFLQELAHDLLIKPNESKQKEYPYMDAIYKGLNSC